MFLSMHCWDEPDILKVVAIPQWLTLFRGVCVFGVLFHNESKERMKLWWWWNMMKLSLLDSNTNCLPG